MWLPKHGKALFVTLITFASLTSTALGRDVDTRLEARDRSSRMGVAPHDEGLFLQVPAGLPDGSSFVVEFRLDDTLVAKQSMLVPRPGSVIELLPEAGHVLRQLRAAEAERKGAVRIRVIAAENQLQAGSLTEFDTTSSAIQASRAITRSGARLRMAPDHLTACNEWCDQRWEECKAECGPRGSTECDICEQDYQNCNSGCCRDQHSQVTQATLVGKYYLFTDCWYPGPQLFNAFRLEYRVDTYNRIEHCDGSVEMTLVNREYQTEVCWEPTGTSCSYPAGVVPQCGRN